MLNFRLNRYLLFSVFYFVQGAIQSYLSNFQKPYLVGQGIAIEQIAWLSSAMLFPFTIKIVFGWFSDRFVLFGDNRKSYMCLGLALAAASYFTIAFVEPATQFRMFFWLILISSTGMAIFDTCADGLAIDIAAPREAGRVQSSMMFGRGIGYILLSFVFGQLATQVGYQAVFLTLALLILLVLLYVVAVCPQVKPDQRGRLVGSLATAKSYWRLEGKAFVYLSVFAVIYSIPSFGIDGLTTLFGKMRLNLGDDVLGQMGSLQGIGSITGALLAAVVIARLGVRAAAYLAVLMLTMGGFLLCVMSSMYSVFLITFLWGVVWAFQETMVLTLSMQVARGPFAATAFAALMMFSNVGTSMGEWLGLKLVASVDLEMTFRLLALGNLLLLPYLWLYFRQNRRQTVGS